MTAFKLVLLIGVIMCVLAAFGVQPTLTADFDLFQMGVGRLLYELFGLGHESY